MPELHFEQLLPISLDEAWSFFSDPANLQAITPPHMGFIVTSQHHGETMYPGQIIRYIVKPLWGIPLKWCTEITHVVRKSYFVDEQRMGPYALWHHQHHFREVEGGVLMQDILNYQVPMWILGDVVDALLVHRKVNEIFAFRKQVLAKRFG